MNAMSPALIPLLALAACGDNRLKPDGAIHHDAGNPDATSIPAPPTLGPQIDRLGRPAISTALAGVFAPAGVAKTALKDAYNHATDPSTWKTTTLQTNVSIELAFEANLAMFDGLDKGLGTVPGLPGCGNALKYVGPPIRGSSYLAAADLFADDQLYVDTSKASCNVYFALELELAGSAAHTTCGGRTLKHDVIDVTYSVLMAGISGLDPASDPPFAPRIHDGVSAHGDVTETFPFLGPAH